jgi:hypothetical protein
MKNSSELSESAFIVLISKIGFAATQILINFTKLKSVILILVLHFTTKII